MTSDNFGLVSRVYSAHLISNGVQDLWRGPGARYVWLNGNCTVLTKVWGHVKLEVLTGPNDGSR